MAILQNTRAANAALVARQRVFRKSMPADLIRGWVPVLRSEYAQNAVGRKMQDDNMQG
jgi:hypothetical protein